MTGLIIIIAAVLLIGYFVFKRAKAKVKFNYANTEKSIKEALLKLQTEEEAIASETTPTIVVEEKVKPPTMSSKKKKKSNNR
jgi:hypothetical protein